MGPITRTEYYGNTLKHNHHLPLRLQLPSLLLIMGLVLAFLDESIRKAIPDHSVLITSGKDGLFFLAAVLILAAGHFPLPRYVPFFVCWMLVTLVSSVYSGFVYESPVGLIACLRTYTLSPLLFFCCGYFLGAQQTLLRVATIVFVCGAFMAVVVTFLQERARDSLPSFLSMRLYIESHDWAGGTYNESLFASPQILAQVMIVLLALLCTYIIATEPLRLGGWLLAFLGVLSNVVALLLTRIRTAAVFAIVVFVLVWMLSAKTRPLKLLTKRTRLVLIGCSVAAFLAALVFSGIMSGGDVESNDRLNRDMAFYAYIFDSEELAYRIGLFNVELDRLVDHNWLFGYGAGTGGSLRSFYKAIPDDIPSVYDTGFFLIYHELGIVGVFAFLASYGALTLHCLRRIVIRRLVPNELVPSFAISVVFLLWFVLKSHTCIQNGLSHFLWMGSLGICCAALDKEEASYLRMRSRLPGEPREVKHDALRENRAC